MKKSLFIAAISALLTFSSCNVPPETVYFQDSEPDSFKELAKQEKIKFRNGDKLYIMVNSKDANLMGLFNLTISNNMSRNSNNIGGSTTSLGSGQNTAYYIINDEGDIEFPVLGKLHIAGMTRAEIAEMIQNRLRNEDHVRDAIVTVEYNNLSVSIMGEVGSPGKYSIDRDKYTIVDLIASAGDINMYGRRDRVKVYREENGKRHTYQVNLMSADSTFNSPVYYLQQDDIVYVEPNEVKRRTGTVNGNSMLTPSFWISIASFCMSVGVLIFR